MTFCALSSAKGMDIKMKEDPDVLYFAKALLIPRFSFERMLKRLRSDGTIGNALIAQLASIYKVPTGDIINRILDLKELEEIDKM